MRQKKTLRFFYFQEGATPQRDGERRKAEE